MIEPDVVNDVPSDTQSVLDFAFEGNTVRVVQHGEPWWVANDLCVILGISNSRQALSKLKPGEKAAVTLNDISSNGTVQGRSMNVVNEKGLYRLIFKSRKPIAEKFQDWVFEEVLPSIRKHGAYMTQETLVKIEDDPEALTELTEKLRKEMKADYDLRKSKSLFQVIGKLGGTTKAFNAEKKKTEVLKKGVKKYKGRCDRENYYPVAAEHRLINKYFKERGGKKPYYQVAIYLAKLSDANKYPTFHQHKKSGKGEGVNLYHKDLWEAFENQLRTGTLLASGLRYYLKEEYRG